MFNSSEPPTVSSSKPSAFGSASPDLQTAGGVRGEDCSFKCGAGCFSSRVKFYIVMYYETPHYKVSHYWIAHFSSICVYYRFRYERDHLIDVSSEQEELTPVHSLLQVINRDGTLSESFLHSFSFGSGCICVCLCLLAVCLGGSGAVLFWIVSDSQKTWAAGDWNHSFDEKSRDGTRNRPNVQVWIPSTQSISLWQRILYFLMKFIWCKIHQIYNAAK